MPDPIQSNPSSAISENKPKNSPSNLYSFFKKSYPLDDPKRVTKEALVGTPSFLAGYTVNALINKAGTSLLPRMPLPPTKPETSPSWYRYQPLNHLIKKNYISPSMAIRFYAPVSEELLFRGLLMPGMQKGLEATGIPEKPAKIASMIGNSALFSAMHPKANRRAFFFNSLIYSALTHYFDDSLIPATTAHMANNHVALTLAKTVVRK